MAPKERRQREKDELKNKILDAARELFVANGYEAVTMRKIAEKIEYTPTAIYVHFQDKDTLLRELCDADFRALRVAFERIGRNADPVERLRKLGLAYAEFALDHPNHYRFMFMTPSPFTLTEPRVSSIERGNPDVDAYAFLRATVAEGIAAGRYRPEYKDAELLAQTVWSGVHGVVSLYLTKATDPWIDWRPVQKTLRLVMETMMRGLLRENG
jgi:AcrR family transcriptional regulator